MTTVLLFARARELAGARRVELDGATVAEVLDVAAERFGPEFAELCGTCTVVVDGETLLRSEHGSTAPGDELAILPPVSGGAGEDGAHDRDAHDGGAHAHDVSGPDELRVVVVTVSDRASRGDYEDLTGPAVEQLAAELLGATIVGREIVADEPEAIAASIVAWCDGGRCDLLLTNGGTGLSPRDVTPEATRSVLDAEAPGLGELMRSAGLAHTPMAALSRQAAGRRGHTIVVNLPGSAKGATESLEAVAAVLPHAVSSARGPAGATS